MSSINNSTYASLHHPARNANAYTKNNTTSSTTKDDTLTLAPSRADAADTDKVDLSPEARERQTALVQRGESSLTPVNPAKPLNVGSEEYDKFRTLMDTVKQQKSSVMSRITSVLEKKGINLVDLGGTLKIEVGKDGRAIVGGIEDKNLAAIIQKALNEDPTLVADIAEYRKNEKTLSNQIKDYTGYSLYEMAQTTRGDINERIRMEYGKNGGTPPPDFFMRLGFIGSMQDFITPGDIAALSFEKGNGDINFSAEVTVMSDPEGGIREAMGGMFGKVREEFDALNAELSGNFLDANAAEITVDNRGMIQVGGQLSKDKSLNNQGISIIKRLVQEMLLEVGHNSYGVNLFTAASQGMIDREVREGEAGWESKVVARMQGGVVKDIRLSAAGDSNELEEWLQGALRKASAHIRK